MLNPEIIERNCLPQCPLQCNRAQFRTQISTSYLAGDLFVDDIELNKNLLEDFVTNAKITPDMAKNSIVRVNIYYDSLSYTLSNESPKTDIAAFLANIGGTISLFLGVSVLSIFEVIECVIEIYFIMRSNKMQIKN